MPDEKSDFDTARERHGDVCENLREVLSDLINAGGDVDDVVEAIDSLVTSRLALDATKGAK